MSKQPRNEFFIGSMRTGFQEVSRDDVEERMRVLARRCDYCGKEPCACPGPEKSEWCVWCEGYRRLRHRIEHVQTKEAAHVCADCWGSYSDRYEYDDNFADVEPEWIDTALPCGHDRKRDTGSGCEACRKLKARFPELFDEEGNPR